MRAEVGDEVVVAGASSPEQDRVGTVVAVEGRDGEPPYLVRWLAGYESEILPGPGDRIEVRRRRPRAAGLTR